MMTKVGLLFEEEKIQYGREIEKRVTKNVTKNVTQHVTRNKELEFTKKCSMPVYLSRRSAE
ncbi:hypothetical protein [Schaedlerella arabinosiphila]|uniref:hypothetical protein n=1 Tax=Schaedlerella arabinosiphila TaxID=2044587 RepID=UPI0003A8E691|nr:hypothetical protein [Schaedlerella arabinosiphila]